MKHESGKAHYDLFGHNIMPLQHTRAVEERGSIQFDPRNDPFVGLKLFPIPRNLNEQPGRYLH